MTIKGISTTAKVKTTSIILFTNSIKVSESDGNGLHGQTVLFGRENPAGLVQYSVQFVACAAKTKKGKAMNKANVIKIFLLNSIILL